MVKFVEEVVIDINIYHLFADKINKRYFYLRPRYVGYQIEGVFVDKQIIVNLFILDSEIYQSDKKQSISYATGALKLLLNLK
jgi:hypothetical protein